MYNLINLNKSQTIGDSISDINSNYQTLEDWTLAIQTSATNYWQPMIDLYENRKLNWNEVLTISHAHSAKWVSSLNSVRAYSAIWLKPISIFYPGVFNVYQDANVTIDIVTRWLNNNFPVTADFSPTPFYIEGQELFIFNYFNEVAKDIKKNVLTGALTTCTTWDQVARIQCRTLYMGVANCANSDMPCDNQYSDCERSKPVACRYSYPYVMDNNLVENVLSTNVQTLVDGDFNIVRVPGIPYTGPSVVNYQAAFSILEAFINIKYKDIRESRKLAGLKYRVFDCRWVFNGLIGTSSVYGNIPMPLRQITTFNIYINWLNPESVRTQYYTVNNGGFYITLTNITRYSQNPLVIVCNGSTKSVNPGDGAFTISGLNSQSYNMTIQDVFTKKIYNLVVVIGYTGYGGERSFVYCNGKTFHQGDTIQFSDLYYN